MAWISGSAIARACLSWSTSPDELCMLMVATTLSSPDFASALSGCANGEASTEADQTQTEHVAALAISNIGGIACRA